jgi:hypothetical protein
MAYQGNGRKDTDGVFFKSKKIKEVKRQQNFVAFLPRKKRVISYGINSKTIPTPIDFSSMYSF